MITLDLTTNTIAFGMQSIVLRKQAAIVVEKLAESYPEPISTQELASFISERGATRSPYPDDAVVKAINVMRHQIGALGNKLIESLVRQPGYKPRYRLTLPVTIMRSPERRTA